MWLGGVQKWCYAHSVPADHVVGQGQEEVFAVLNQGFHYGGHGVGGSCVVREEAEETGLSWGDLDTENMVEWVTGEDRQGEDWLIEDS